jgi:hypothetical protein
MGRRKNNYVYKECENKKYLKEKPFLPRIMINGKITYSLVIGLLVSNNYILKCN